MPLSDNERPVCPDNIPDALKAYDQWLVWRREGGTKVPYRADGGGLASSTDPATWSTFAAAYHAYVERGESGIGFVFTADDPFCGIDLDDCIDSEEGRAPWASALLQSLSTYSEVSPSERGIKLIACGALPGGTGIKRKGARVAESLKPKDAPGGIEAYDRGRFFTITGWRVEDTPASIQPAQQAIDALAHALRGADVLPRPSSVAITPTAPPSDARLAAWAGWLKDEAAARMRAAGKGERHATRFDMGRWAGGLIPHGLASESEIQDLIYDAQPPQQRQVAEWRTIAAGIAAGCAAPLDLPSGDPEPLMVDGVACCPFHQTPLPRANNGNGYKCHQPDTSSPSGWCRYWWPGDGYTPPERSPNDRRTMPERSPNDASGRPNDSEQSTNYTEQRGRGRLLSSAQLDDLPPPRWLIQGVIPADDLTTVYGPSGAGKSFALVDIAATVAQTATVVYVAAEALATYRERRSAWCARHGRDTAGLLWWSDAVNLLIRDEVDTFITSVLPHKPALIIFDTLARCLVGGDENSAQDMGRAVDAVDHIRRELGCAIVLVHHTGKSGTTERGSSALRGGCATMIELSNNDGLITIRSDKTRHGAPFAPRYFRLTASATSAVLTPTSKVAGRALPVMGKQIQVLEVLRRAYYGGRATFNELAEATEISKSTLSESVSRLMERGYVHKEKEGRTTIVTLTDVGRDFLLEHDLEANDAEPSEQTTERSTFNWHVCSEEGGDRSAHQDASFGDRSAIVRSSFGVPPIVRSVGQVSIPDPTEQRGEPGANESEPAPTEEPQPPAPEAAPQPPYIPPPIERAVEAVDWPHVRTLYAQGTIGPIRVHAALRHLDADNLLAQLAAEVAEGGGPDG